MNMVVYTLEHSWEILRHYFENHVNVAESVRKLYTDFGRREAASALYIRYLVKKVKETGIFINHPRKLLLWQKVNINSPSFSTTEHFGDIIVTNFV